MTASHKWLLAGVLAILGCGHASPRRPDPLRGYNAEAIQAGDVRDFGSVYQQMGIVSSPPPISFVAEPAFFATRSPDTTLAVLSISLPNRGLTFQHDGPMFRAEYEVTLVLLQDTAKVRQISVRDTVRVATLKETSRTDESILFRQTVRVSPGRYTIAYRIFDAFGNREAAGKGTLIIPRYPTVSLSSAVVVYEAKVRRKITDVPQYLPAPRSSATFGSDVSLPVYLEAYGTKITTPVGLSLRNSKGITVWQDTGWLAQRDGFAASIVNIPLDHADIGIFDIVAVHMSATGSDTTRTPIFVGFGADLPVLSFNDMIKYLRYFASYKKIRLIEEAPEASRGEAWRKFLRETDPTPATPQNEALQAYFQRIQNANILFRLDNRDGWLSDRGSVYVALGEPDTEQERIGPWIGRLPSLSPTVHYLIWEYRDLNATLVFYDQTGAGQWHFLPESESLFHSLEARRLQ